MDSDEYDDDIADEDLIVAASQAPPSRAPATASRHGSSARKVASMVWRYPNLTSTATIQL